MKRIIFFTAILTMFNSVTFCQSLLNYQTGTSLEVQTGATVCADNVIMNGTFTGDGTLCGLFSTLYLTAFIEGFYNPSTNSMVSDTVKVYLRNAAFPYTIIDSTKSTLNSTGLGTFTFSYPVNGVNYYIVIKHRNSIETWSKTTQQFTASALSYDFTTANTQAYGNNMPNIDASPVRFGIYSGDENQNGIVDLTDAVNVSNAASSFTSGYVTSDMNGDNITDLSDLVITSNNASAFVSKIIP